MRAFLCTLVYRHRNNPSWEWTGSRKYKQWFQHTTKEQTLHARKTASAESLASLEIPGYGTKWVVQPCWHSGPSSNSGKMPWLADLKRHHWSREMPYSSESVPGWPDCEEQSDASIWFIELAPVFWHLCLYVLWSIPQREEETLGLPDLPNSWVLTMWWGRLEGLWFDVLSADGVSSRLGVGQGWTTHCLPSHSWHRAVAGEKHASGDKRQTTNPMSVP